MAPPPCLPSLVTATMPMVLVPSQTQPSIPSEKKSLLLKPTMLVSLAPQIQPFNSLSPIEGGHRTLQMIKFFTGADFTNKSPQPFKPLHRSSNWTDILPAKKIHQHGLAMTTYNISFWQRFDKTNLLGGNDAFELRLQSNWFQQSFKVVCKDTNDNLLAKVLQKLDTLFKCKDGDQFTTTKFFQNVDDSIKKLDARMMQAYPVILECVKTISPAKEQFAILTAALKRKYDAATPSLKSVPLYSNLHRSLVSAAAPLFHFQ